MNTLVRETHKGKLTLEVEVQEKGSAFSALVSEAWQVMEVAAAFSKLSNGLSLRISVRAAVYNEMLG